MNKYKGELGIKLLLEFLTKDFDLPGVFQTLFYLSPGQNPAGQVASVLLYGGSVDQPTGGHALVLLLLNRRISTETVRCSQGNRVNFPGNIRPDPVCQIAVFISHHLTTTPDVSESQGVRETKTETVS